MFRLLRRVSIATLAVLALSTPLAGAASAAPSDSDGTVTWMVRPSDGVGEDGRSWVELELDPGETVEEHLIVRNLSTETVVFRLLAADGYFTDTGRFNMLTSDQESTDAGTWIDIQETIEVPSGGDAVVPFSVTVPENATPGDHPAGVAAVIRSGEDEQIGVESRVGFRVMTRVTGDLAPAASAEVTGSFAGSWNPFETGRLDVEYAIENTGNTRLSLTPQITVSALFGLVSFTLPGEEITEIAPGESRAGSVAFPNVWPLFVYDAELSAPATAVVTGDDAAPSVEPAAASAAVVAIPWPQLVTLLIAGLLLWWLWTDRRRRDRKISTMLESARQEGREESVASDTAPEAVAEPEAAPTGLRRDRRNRASAFIALLLTAGFALTAVPAHAATIEPDPGQVSLRVEVTPAPTSSPTPTSTPTSSPTPTPTPSPTSDAGDLPPTGAPDLTALACAGGILSAIGLGALLVRRSRRRGATR